MAQKLKDKQALKRLDETIKRITSENRINPFETEQEKNTRIARAKTDFKFFVETYFKHYAESVRQLTDSTSELPKKSSEKRPTRVG